ncbi:MAG: precorrin-6y C5,15-methyltransferase (decarboxylating) subunit CbiE [Syntrophales bacterium]|nr:precorrin-6y C5,15-methyltransferase (decarboxylating) subunit CbiE [Syntrophales bacterium]
MAVNPIITIAGCGPGGVDYVTPAVRKAVSEADTLVGASRVLNLFADHGYERIQVGTDIESVLQAIEDRYRTRKVVVLVTGDPGLCSLAGPVLKRFGPEFCHVIPGISSIQAAFASVGLDWQDARIIDAHGTTPVDDASSLKENAKIAVLLGSGAALKWAASLVKDLDNQYRAFLCEDLTLPEEQIREVMPDKLEMTSVSSRSILLCIKKEICL